MNKITTTAVLAALVMSPPVVASVNEPLVPFWSCYQQLILTLDKLNLYQVLGHN